MFARHLLFGFKKGISGRAGRRHKFATAASCSSGLKNHSDVLYRDDVILFNSIGLTCLGLVLPGWQSIPLFNGQGLVVMLLLHASVAEWLYYWFHRSLHHHWLYARYHSHHHQSFVTEPVTGMSPAELSLLPLMHSIIFVNWKARKRHLEGVENAESVTSLLQRLCLVMQNSSICGQSLQGFYRSPRRRRLLEKAGLK